MAKLYFLDSSALVKRYVTEKGSQWLQQLNQPNTGHLFIVARVTWVEIISAFSRLQRENILDSTDITQAIRSLDYDWNTQYQVVEFDVDVMAQAGRLAQMYPLRAYDAVQLASALRIQAQLSGSAPFVFVCADNRLLSVAEIVGLQVDNPNSYA